MYKNNFVAVVKCNGEVLREKQKENVFLPFSSEYSIFLKNLENRRASVKIFIDGQNIFGEHGSYILGAHQECEIERFVGENLNSGNRFKFIKKTAEISQYRGDRIDDGLICVEFVFEKQIVHEQRIIHNTYVYPNPPYYHFPTYPFSPYCLSSTVSNKSLWDNEPMSVYNSNVSKEINMGSTFNASSIVNSNAEAYRDIEPISEEGITVKGSISNQRFTEVSIGELEEASHTFTLRLKGYVSAFKSEVKKPITTHEKLICSSCGLASGTDASFCKKCGTCLISY